MATVRHVFMGDCVAEILGEHPEPISAIVSDDVSFGPDDILSAITDNGIDELRAMIAEARRSPEEWNSFLECVVYDDDEMEAIGARYAAKQPASYTARLSMLDQAHLTRSHCPQQTQAIAADVRCRRTVTETGPPKGRAVATAHDRHGK